MHKLPKEEWKKFFQKRNKYPLVITNEWIDKLKEEWLKTDLNKRGYHPYEHVWRWGFCGLDMSKHDLSKLDKEHMALLTFDSSTIWPSKDKMPKDFDPEAILARGKDPMLGVRELHKQGITGKGVVVACIDAGFQARDHTEFKGANIHVKNLTDEKAHFHGEDVLANLMGKNIGVAPNAECYYYGTDTCRGETWAHQIIDSLNDVLEKINSGVEIRVIFHSGPMCFEEDYERNSRRLTQMYGSMDNYKKVFGIVKKLKELGCEFVDSAKFNSDFIPCYLDYYDDYSKTFQNLKLPDWSEDVFPKEEREYVKKNCVGLVCGGKVVPEFCDNEGYKFVQDCCSSWSIPQAVGLYALCLQQNTNISWEEFVEISKSTAKQNQNDVKVAMPKEIIKEVERLKTEREELEV